MRTRTLIAGGVVAAFLAGAQPVAAATTIVVDDDGMATPTDCNEGAPAPATIQPAVNAGDPGDIIKVCPGTYNEQVAVNKSLTLLGAQAGVDARSPARTGATGTEAIVRGALSAGKRTTPFNVTGSNVTIDGFTVQDQSDKDNLGYGIVLGAGTTGQAVRNNVVQNNIIGLSLGSDNSTIEHNAFRTNNQPGPATGTAIYTDQVDAGGSLTGVVIDENEFTVNTATAISFSASNPSQGASSVTVSDNTFTNNGAAFSAFNWFASTFTRNVVTGSTGSQVVLGGRVTNSTFTENVIANGKTRGIRIGDFGGGGTNSADTVRCNSITGNASAGLELFEDVGAGAYTGTLAAGLNWWGSPTGPTIASNPGGSGQSLVPGSSSVAFTPFLTSGADSDPGTPGFQCVPGASVGDATIGEGGGTVNVPVTLDNTSDSTVTVAFTTQDGTATSGSDYTSTSETVTFAPGEQSKTVGVPVTGDTGFEPDETFAAKLLSPSNTTIADGDGVVTITNDDAQPPGGPAADLVAPLANRLKASPKSFFAARSGASLGTAAAKKRKKKETGTKVTYSLSEAATTTFTVQRSVAGRVKSGKCRRRSRSNRKGRRCTLFTGVRGSFTHAGKAGANSFKFTGRVGRRTLKPGSYRLNGTPKDAAGNTGKVARVSFKVKR